MSTKVPAGKCIEHGKPSWFERDNNASTGWSLKCESGTVYLVGSSRIDLVRRIIDYLEGDNQELRGKLKIARDGLRDLREQLEASL